MKDNLFHKPSNLVFLAKRNTGKSWFISHLLYSLIKSGVFHWGVVVTTTKFEGEYFFIPDRYVLEEYNEDLLSNILKKQEKYISEKKPKNMFIVLDDVIGSVEFNTPTFKKFWTTCRHNNIWCFVALQHLFSFPRYARLNVDYMFLLQNGNLDVIKQVYQEFLGDYRGGWNKFIQDFNNHVKNYFILVVDNMTKSSEFNDRFFLMRAHDKPIPSTFKFQFKLN